MFWVQTYDKLDKFGSREWKLNVLDNSTHGEIKAVFASGKLCDVTNRIKVSTEKYLVPIVMNHKNLSWT